jgi:hypothetical protein
MHDRGVPQHVQPLVLPRMQSSLFVLQGRECCKAHVGVKVEGTLVAGLLKPLFSLFSHFFPLFRFVFGWFLCPDYFRGLGNKHCCVNI